MVPRSSWKVKLVWVKTSDVSQGVLDGPVNVQQFAIHPNVQTGRELLRDLHGRIKAYGIMAFFCPTLRQSLQALDQIPCGCKAGKTRLSSLEPPEELLNDQDIFMW